MTACVLPRYSWLPQMGNQSIVGHPQGVLHGAHALEVVDVAGGNDAFGAYLFGHHAHQFGDGLLVVVAVAAQVVGDVEVALVVIDAVVNLFLCRGPRAHQDEGEQEECLSQSHVFVAFSS